MFKKILLGCGLLSSVLYLAIDTLAALRYPAYHSYVSQAISELGANGAPTQQLVHPLFLVYDLLLIAFGVGLWASAHREGRLRLIAALLIGIGVVGFLTPPMQLRGTGDVSGDLPHIVLTGVLVLFIILAVASGASLYSKRFRLYSFATILTILLSGALTGVAASRLAAGQPTPWLGIAERINIGAYLLWVAVLSIIAALHASPGARANSFDKPVRPHTLTTAAA
jgi:hypothetical protein